MQCRAMCFAVVFVSCLLVQSVLSRPSRSYNPFIGSDINFSAPESFENYKQKVNLAHQRPTLLPTRLRRHLVQLYIGSHHFNRDDTDSASKHTASNRRHYSRQNTGPKVAHA